MRIIGMGVDLVENARIAGSIAKFGDAFLTRVFRPGEIAYCQSMRNSAPHFAARFAAKEAISKAFGCGIGAELGWQDLEIVRAESGAPAVVYHGAGCILAAARGVTQTLLTVSHTENYSVANALLLGE